MPSRRNCSSDDGAERTDDGRAFHARAAVTGKARSPSVVHGRVDGMTSVDMEVQYQPNRTELESSVVGSITISILRLLSNHRCTDVTQHTVDNRQSKQVVSVIRLKAASPPRSNRSIVFARLRRYAPVGTPIDRVAQNKPDCSAFQPSYENLHKIAPLTLVAHCA